MSFVYLASPYTPLEGEDVQSRVDAACHHAALLMAQGYAVFSPIAHSHYVADHLSDNLRMDHEFWMRQDLPVLRAASKVFVLMLPGWDKSKGVARELEVAKVCGIPVEHIHV